MNTRFKIFLSLTIFYALLIFYLSAGPSPGSPGAIFDFLNLESLMSVFKSLEDSNLGFLLYPLYIASMYPDKV
ncbi:MAG TPA: hypothetical protein VIO58_12190, partial [Candidatus Methanoperedens sp.]